jgi:hypothetical protein
VEKLKPQAGIQRKEINTSWDAANVVTNSFGELNVTLSIVLVKANKNAFSFKL